MSHHPEHFQLPNIVDNALLHLYGVVSQTQRFVPTIKRNEILEDEHGFNSKLFDPNSIAIPDVIYVLPEHIENCFSDEGMQVAPVSLFIESERAMNLLSIIGESQLFSAEMQEWNETTHQAHILLHPISH